jgi:hypothetical protein
MALPITSTAKRSIFVTAMAIPQARSLLPQRNKKVGQGLAPAAPPVMADSISAPKTKNARAYARAFFILDK